MLGTCRFLSEVLALMNDCQVFSAPCNGCAKECFLVFDMSSCRESKFVVWPAMCRNAQMCEGSIIQRLCADD